MDFILYAATDDSSHPFSLPAVYSVLKELFTMLYLSRGIIDHIFQTSFKFLLLVANYLQILHVMADILLR